MKDIKDSAFLVVSLFIAGAIAYALFSGSFEEAVQEFNEWRFKLR